MSKLQLSMKFKYLTKNPIQTQKLGKILAKEILKGGLFEKVLSVGSRRNSSKALVLGLEGDLGGGKTIFLQGLAKGLGIRQKILSPTFVIMRKFKIPLKEIFRFPARQAKFRFQTFYHIDCYRIQKPKEILDLEFKKILANPKNIIAIEWADRIKKIIPKDSVWIKFGFVNQKVRKIMIK